MRSIEAAVEQVVASAEGIDGEILALVELGDRVQAALVDRVGAFDAAEGWAADGDFSFACWLRARTDVSRAESLQLGRFARALRTMPVTEEAVREAKLSVAKARLLAGVVNERTEERFAEQEGFLVEQVQGLSVDHAKTALDYWRRLADSDGPEPDDPDRNWASLTAGLGGRWHLEADLDPVSGAILNATLQAIQDRMHQDGRFADLTPATDTGTRRSADALVEMARRASGTSPEQPAVHPDVVVVVPVAALSDGAPDPFDPPELVGVGPITIGDALRLAVMGSVSTLTVDEAGRPLNLGRKRRLASGDQWIALAVRDRGCVVPGCDRRPAWCHAHHLRYWEKGGPSDLSNLCLVCTKHHHLIHDQQWSLESHPDGSWRLHRPDGSVVDPPRYSGNGRPPPRARPPG